LCTYTTVILGHESQGGLLESMDISLLLKNVDLQGVRQIPVEADHSNKPNINLGTLYQTGLQ